MQNYPGRTLKVHFQKIMVLTVLLGLTFAVQEVFMAGSLFAGEKQDKIELSDYRAGDSELAELLYARRSVRSFSPGEIKKQDVTRALFSAQGVTREDRFRTIPSAGALYPLELYLVAQNVQDLQAGVYKYLPREHALKPVRQGDKLEDLAQASLGQMWISQAQAAVVVTAVYERVTGKYGARGEQYVHMEAGCAAQSLSLQAAELGLGTTAVGAFHDNQVQKVLGAKDNEVPMLVMPLGKE